MTLSQAGMIQHWRRDKEAEPRWRRYIAANAAGATATSIVLVIVLLTRVTHGGWMVVCAIRSSCG